MDVWAAGLAGHVLVFLHTAVVASWLSWLCMGMWLMPGQLHGPRVCVKTPENKCVTGAPCSAGSWLWSYALSVHATEASSTFPVATCSPSSLLHQWGGGQWAGPAAGRQAGY